MQSHYGEYQSISVAEAFLERSPAANAEDLTVETASSSGLARFHGKFEDCMVLYSSASTVTEYLNAHQEWFCRCARPMAVQPLGKNGYVLTIGRFGAFGYDVEPKVGLELLPPDEGVYRIRTIPVPNYVAPGYDVDFNAAMDLKEVAASVDGRSVTATRVEWNLDLVVTIDFPRFIHRLPKSLIQTTGDRLLMQIVRQVSRSLTHKVIEDFHNSLGEPIPAKAKKKVFLASS